LVALACTAKPLSLVQLLRLTNAMLPASGLSEMLLQVFSSTSAASAFTSIISGESDWWTTGQHGGVAAGGRLQHHPPTGGRVGVETLTGDRLADVSLADSRLPPRYGQPFQPRRVRRRVLFDLRADDGPYASEDQSVQADKHQVCGEVRGHHAAGEVAQAVIGPGRQDGSRVLDQATRWKRQARDSTPPACSSTSCAEASSEFIAPIASSTPAATNISNANIGCLRKQEGSVSETSFSSMRCGWISRSSPVGLTLLVHRRAQVRERWAGPRSGQLHNGVQVDRCREPSMSLPRGGRVVSAAA
jgi:hypothetical protein